MLSVRQKRQSIFILIFASVSWIRLCVKVNALLIASVARSDNELQARELHEIDFLFNTA